jgi:hypothetical protein
MGNEIADGKIEKVATPTGIRRVPGVFGEWFGLSPGDAPRWLRNTGNQQIYALTGKLRRCVLTA